jgi:hypothetical protein
MSLQSFLDVWLSLLLVGSVAIGPINAAECGATAPGAAFVVTATANPSASCPNGSGVVSSSEGACYTTSNGRCITDGPDTYRNNERCTIFILYSTRLIANQVVVQSGNNDFFLSSLGVGHTARHHERAQQPLSPRIFHAVLADRWQQPSTGVEFVCGG